MKPIIPSESELDVLAQHVDDQFRTLKSQSTREAKVRSGSSGRLSRLPIAPIQQAVIEKNTGESFESFWSKFKRHTRRDLCLPGGHLYQEWQKWRDLRSKVSVKVAFGVIAGMGIPTASIAPVAVAATVFLLNAISNIGIDAICEGCAEEEVERKKALKEAAKARKQKP